MKKCKTCDNLIDDKYIVCMDCLSANKESSSKDSDVVRAIQQTNNNLYALRTILEEFLSEKGKLLVWNKEKKCFDIKKAKK